MTCDLRGLDETIHCSTFIMKVKPPSDSIFHDCVCVLIFLPLPFSVEDKSILTVEESYHISMQVPFVFLLEKKYLLSCNNRPLLLYSFGYLGAGDLFFHESSPSLSSLWEPNCKGMSLHGVLADTHLSSSDWNKV